MSRQLPPSPNWYSSSCCDWSAGGLVAYAAKSAVRFLDPSTRRIVGELLGHDDRVTTLTFVRSPPWLHVCVTGSADKTVRAWDSESSSCMSCLRDQHQLEVVAVASSAAMGPLILSVDKGGVLVAWDFASSSSRSACPMKMPATCMASTGARTAAVGYANGVILLLDVTTISILHKLVGHDGRDRTIRVWNARVGTSKQEKDSLISGGSNGDVWWWNVKSKRAQKGTGKQLPSRSVFSFALGRLAGDEEEKLKMVCVSMDRTIALWDMQDSLTCRWLLPCLGGYVYDIDRCPSDPARVVLAVGDQARGGGGRGRGSDMPRADDPDVADQQQGAARLSAAVARAAG
ncbi:hypothetical protein GUITHDRAFT_113005 [Guillardia theta CCMP2712]|uniref:Uncharacterized protein n=1 Tax=Guillardia theta (strain CCMP2712) TaxID=905079 RepID=L1IY22_GUITC|nr:hypothetical protein GUITHDRAFT_113005 [Guillardia theta CCMP2712]EKX41002.1 hypothetical protein GUITHDRAFT_113005 [Guillardia theta CCMP2712]|eukprot:XP_005827982.1 hypothetical protein GUITHDRAFT_113005 [Guillardia theta CCMP2712]